MTQGGDAAEQIVRLSLEGMEVAVKVSGESAKNIALILMAVLREEHKTKGKARLSSMIRSGKELKVFSVQNKDLEKFAREAKRYGVLYCVLKDKGDRSGNGAADIIARAEDAAKIQRIVDRFGLSKVERGSAVSEIRDDRKKTERKINGRGSHRGSPERRSSLKTPAVRRWKKAVRLCKTQGVQTHRRRALKILKRSHR